ncbi:hypothetical protein KXD93_10290 [Mucilaginibacter sp. BJC16-A38]|uniref:hypothetical protein n=1 Tax=Mucilaginibacter phenanthrenivorans TaxID=1234842 RepID=UPI0021574100|nr:hypothetical protein [Mucilaginibacter phenanthrenivorans]MCR8558034.1 hypothetical protein [Mucilaginibacter phenanthrenivorans]
MQSKIAILFTFFIVFLMVSGCENEKFDKDKWASYEHLNGSDRSSMAEDLLKSRKLIGLSNRQMLQLLGPPENDTTETWYTLKLEFPFLSVDPESGKDLIIKFNKDSIITNAKIHEWHHN